MNELYNAVGCKNGEFLYVHFKFRLGRAGGVSLMPETPITYSHTWASFVDSRGRHWDVPMDNIGAITHKKIKRSGSKGIWEPATND